MEGYLHRSRAAAYLCTPRAAATQAFILRSIVMVLAEKLERRQGGRDAGDLPGPATPCLWRAGQPFIGANGLLANCGEAALLNAKLPQLAGRPRSR
jgi:hypothetical protein